MDILAATDRRDTGNVAAGGNCQRIVGIIGIHGETELRTKLGQLWQPSEQRLALMRPVSLAGLFAALSGTVTGAINVLRLIWMSEGPVNWKTVAVGSAESLVPLWLAFGCLAVAWLCVAAGFRRQS